MRRDFIVRSFAALLGGAILTAAAPADVIQLGQYRLHNHPDAETTPPPYGARFDEMFDATSGHDVFTLDFDDINSAAFMTVTATTVRIFGQAFGGRDVGSAYANDQYLGVYTFDFLYNVGVQTVPGDDDIWAAVPGGSNFGTIVAPNGVGTKNLTDEADGGFTFRFGDENNDAGHRGFDGLSGWGWMSYVNDAGGRTHVASTDWIFTAVYDIPSPGAASLLIAGGLFAGARRRRN